MSSLVANPAARALRRHRKFSPILRRGGTSGRAASTNTSEVANAAKDRATQATTKASEGLSRVTSAAGPAISRVGAAASGALGRIGGRTGRFIGFVQSLIPPTIYYSRVGLELGKMIVETRKMQPPSLATFQSSFQPLLNYVRQPATLFNRTAATVETIQPSNVLSQVRNMNREQMISAGIVAAEVLGFFTVGEMIGRRKLVGYRSSEPSGQH